MAIIVVGGQARKVGKTSVVTGLIAALPQYRWTAVKITDHSHDLGSDPYLISEERDRSGETDTSRFLVAGARRALWLRAQPGQLAQAVPALRRELASAEAAILESNSVMDFLDPDLYLIVLEPASSDFKNSARKNLHRASALVLSGAKPARTKPAWEHALGGVGKVPVFQLPGTVRVSSELVAFVRQRLEGRR